MPAAQNSNRQYAWVVETTFNTTPSTPQTQLFNPVSFDGDFSADTLVSETIAADRQVSFARRGNGKTEGTMVVELCPDNYDFALEALLGGTWTTNALMIGNTKRSFAIEEGFTDIGQFRVFNGVMFNTLSLDLKPEGLVQASFGLVGASTSAFTATSIDTTPTAITAKDTFFHEGGTVKEGGTAVGYITSVKLDVTNNLKGEYALTSTAYRNIALGRAEVTGTVTAFFEDVSLYNKFKNSTQSAIEFTLVAGAETLTFNVSKAIYTQGKLTRGNDGLVLVELTFQGIKDATNGSLKITRV